MSQPRVSIIRDIARVGATKDGTPTWRIAFSDGVTRLTKRGSQVGFKVDESWKGTGVIYELQYTSREGTRIVRIDKIEPERKPLGPGW